MYLFLLTTVPLVLKFVLAGVNLGGPLMFRVRESASVHLLPISLSLKCHLILKCGMELGFSFPLLAPVDNTSALHHCSDSR